ncbi:MAG: hypothetical protein K0S30_986 [Clostridia bacterium]|nr:hypothetical protein [Clostridia bacterium]
MTTLIFLQFSFITAWTSSCSGLMAISAPSLIASSLFSATGSVRIILLAPAILANCSIISPIGPPPITTTSSPGLMLHKSMPCTQHETGSVMAAVKASIPSLNLNTCFSGATIYCAKPPSHVVPIPITFSQNCSIAFLQ